MKIRISISREYDTEEDYSDLDLSPDKLEAYLLDLFSEDIDNLVKYNETREAALVSISSGSSSWIVFHKGTGTFFSISDESYALDTSKLSSEDLEELDEGDTEAIVLKNGRLLSDEIFDRITS